MARRTRRSPARRKVAQPQVPGWVIALGVTALGGAAFLFYRAALASPVPPASPMPLPGFAPPDASNSPPGPRLDANGNVMIPASTERLLRSSEAEAREIFALQAMLYTYGATNALPDGIAGSTTNGLIRSYTRLIQPETTYQFDTLAIVRQQLQTLGSPTLRRLPFVMPQDLINAVENSSAAVDSMALPLQVMPSAGPGPAGRANLRSTMYRRPRLYRVVV